MNLKSFLTGVIATIAATTGAHAAVVNSTTSVTGAFDVAGLTPGTITEFAYSCSSVCGANGSGDPENLAGGAHIQLLFGTTAGDSDLGSMIFTSPVAFDIAAIGAALPTSVNVAKPLTTLFVTFAFVDDVFGVDLMRITINRQQLEVYVNELSTSEVPLPAALPLFLAGLAGVGATARRKRQIA